MLQQGRIIAERWVAANPAEGRARLMYATVLTSLGELVAADTILKRAVLTDTGGSSINAQLLRIELSLKAWRGPAALALFDSLRTRTVIVGRSNAGVMTTGNLVVLATPMLGRPSLYDSLISVGMLWTLYCLSVSPVMTASTPGTAMAFSVSIFLILAWAYGLRTMSR